MTKDDEQIRGTDHEEQKRLSLLNDLLNDASLAAISLSGGERILDVGSGLGHLTRRLAAVAGPDGRVVAVERSLVQINKARSLAEEEDEAPVDYRQGDAGELPLKPHEWGTFDVAHARFVLEHVSDAGAVVRGMVRALRPGGRIVLEDDDHSILQLFPEPPEVMDLWRQYIVEFEALGADPFVGRRLVELIHDAGATPERNDWLFFGSCAGDPSLTPMVQNFIGVIQNARARIRNRPDWDDDRIDRILGEFDEWSRLPQSALWYGTFWAGGTKPR